MTKQIDARFIKRKIKLIEEDLLRLKQLEKFTMDEIASDFYKYCTAERLLEVIIMRSVDINSHVIARLGTGIERARGYMDTFLILGDMEILPQKFAKEIAGSAKFRNILAHEYDKIEMDQVYNSIGEGLKDFKKYCKHILKFLDKRKAEEEVKRTGK